MTAVALHVPEETHYTAQSKVQAWVEANNGFRRDIIDRLRDAGPLPSRDLPDTSQVPWSSTGWTNNRNVTQMLELLAARWRSPDGPDGNALGRRRPRLGSLAVDPRHVGGPREEARRDGRLPDRRARVPGWWAQAITNGYERATGMRLKHQQADGFTIYASRTIAVSVEALFDAFVNDGRRPEWLSDATMTLRTSVPGRVARFDWNGGPTRLGVTFDRKGPAKCTVAVAHERLPDADEAENATDWPGPHHPRSRPVPVGPRRCRDPPLTCWADAPSICS
jgi:hypothetical protein